MKKKFIYFFMFVIMVLIILVLFIVNIDKTEKIRIVFENSKEITVEIAKTNEEHENGLMFRKSLDKNKGMFFIFDDSAIRYFWMKNTFIPLDIFFIDENFTIVNIVENVSLCLKEPCENYQSLKPSKYVLEVNVGFSRENTLKSGDKIYIFNMS